MKKETKEKNIGIIFVIALFIIICIFILAINVVITQIGERETARDIMKRGITVLQPYDTFEIRSFYRYRDFWYEVSYELWDEDNGTRIRGKFNFNVDTCKYSEIDDDIYLKIKK